MCHIQEAISAAEWNRSGCKAVENVLELGKLIVEKDEGKYALFVSEDHASMWNICS